MFLTTKQFGLAAAVLALASVTAGRAHADIAVVSGFDSSYQSNGSWFISPLDSGQTLGTASVVSTPPGTPPYSPGAALLTTDLSDDHNKIQVSVADTFGSASQLGTTFTAQYAYYKDTTGGGDSNPSAAVALKLSISDGTNGITFVYEPYWQGSNPTANHWNTASISATSGGFWATGKIGDGFGVTTSAGGGNGPPNDVKSLSDWVTQMNAYNSTEFSAASLYLVGLGLGTYNRGQVGYVDYLTIGGTNVGSGSRTYDFQPAAVPEPSTLAIAGLGALGFLGYGLKRRTQGR